MGIETEYALGGDRREDLLVALVQYVKDHVTGLEGLNPYDRFLVNGARLYVDCGRHPEYATPECTDPADAVRHQLAGDRILSQALGELPDELTTGRGAGIYKCNVDYSGAKTTWGSHESYLHRSANMAIPQWIIPHLVSRVIYTGAGGFDSLSTGINFMLSPRAAHMEAEISGSSTEMRGIFHTKNETLARRGYHRMHLLCGESLCSNIAAWLRVGVTAVVVAMIDAGITPGIAVRLRTPLSALKRFVADPTCQAAAVRTNGSPISALGIQRRYLQLAEENLTHDCMPPWADKVCVEWRRMLDRIENDPESLSNTLDWAIKLAVYRDCAAQRGVEWETIPAWNHVLEEVRLGLRASPHSGMARVELVLGQKSKPSPIPDTIKALTPHVESHGLSWDMMRTVVDLRKELFELDFRFGQLGGGGLFDSLDRAGVLDHRAPGVVRVADAMHAPPREGRAGLRGRRIRRYSGRPNFHCNWDSIWDGDGKRRLDLSDPFATESKWRKVKSRRDLPARQLRRLMGLQPDLFDAALEDTRQTDERA